MTPPYSDVSATSAFSIRTFSHQRTPEWSYILTLHRREHDHALWSRRYTSTQRPLSALIAPPKYTNSTVCLYTWPAAETVNGTFHPLFVCRHIVSVLVPDAATLHTAHAFTINAVILSNPSGDRDEARIVSVQDSP